MQFLRRYRQQPLSVERRKTREARLSGHRTILSTDPSSASGPMCTIAYLTYLSGMGKLGQCAVGLLRVDRHLLPHLLSNKEVIQRGWKPADKP